MQKAIDVEILFKNGTVKRGIFYTEANNIEYAIENFFDDADDYTFKNIHTYDDDFIIFRLSEVVSMTVKKELK
jgi:hypothetical protein